jgi:adenine/guanine phosphoribosyltransferase-like PRPP-binding protein
MKHDTYLDVIFNPTNLMKRAKIISKEIIAHNGYSDEDQIINSIAVCGASGIAFGAVVSAISGIPLIVVRKQEHTHSFNKEVEFPYGDCYNYCMVDDFISTGTTLRRMVDAISKNSNGDPTKLIKIFCYYDSAAYDMNKYKGVPIFCIPK